MDKVPDAMTATIHVLSPRLLCGRHLVSLLVALSVSRMSEAQRTTECARVPVASVPQPRREQTSAQAEFIQGIEQIFRTAYPKLQLVRGQDGAYVVDAGQTFKAELSYERDRESGLVAFVLSYSSQIDAAHAAAKKLTGAGCRAPTELVVARARGDSMTIVARGEFDREAIGIDVRELRVSDTPDGPGVYSFHHAYYAAPGWFGKVTWRASYFVEGTRLVVQRLPASYSKESAGPHAMAGYLAPAGATDTTIRLQCVAFGTRGEMERIIELPRQAEEWISGVEILRRAP
jgi:hypothetical protein